MSRMSAVSIIRQTIRDVYLVLTKTKIGGPFLMVRVSPAPIPKETGGFCFKKNLLTMTVFLWAIMWSMSAHAFRPNVTTDDATIRNEVIYGIQKVILEGVTYNNTVLINGTQDVFDGGMTHNTMLDSGMQIVTNSSAYDTIINGGQQYIVEDGIAFNTTINGGILNIDNGILSDATVNDPGKIIVDEGATLYGTIILNEGSSLLGISSFGNTVTINGTAGIQMNGGTISDTGYGTNSSNVIFHPAVTVTGYGTLEVSQEHKLHFSSLSGNYTVFVPDLNKCVDNALVFYDATTEVAFSLDPRSSEVDGQKVIIIDNGVNQGMSVLRWLIHIPGIIGQVAQLNLAVIDTLTHSPYKRLSGPQRWGGQTSSPVPVGKWTAWAHGITTRLNLTSTNDSRVTLMGSEFGLDVKISESAYGKWFLGLLGQVIAGSPEYVNSTNSIDSLSKGDLNAYAAGIYTAWLGNNGWFMDAALRGYQLNQKVTNPSNEMSGNYKTKQHAVTASLEMGREMVLSPLNSSYQWLITPQMKVNTSYITNDSFVTSTNIPGKLRSATTLNTAVGVSTGPRFKLPKLANAMVQPCLKGMLRYEFGGRTKGEVNGIVTREETLHGLHYELGTGINIYSSTNRLMFWVDALWRKGVAYKSIGGVLGLRVAF